MSFRRGATRKLHFVASSCLSKIASLRVRIHSSVKYIIYCFSHTRDTAPLYANLSPANFSLKLYISYISLWSCHTARKYAPAASVSFRETADTDAETGRRFVV